MKTRTDKLDRWANMRTINAPVGFWSGLSPRERSTWSPSQQLQFFLSHKKDRKALRDYVRGLCGNMN